MEIELDPFQSQELADHEFVLGFSRPLRNFADLIEDPDKAPQLRLYQGGMLTEQPFLGLETTLSNERSLLFRISAYSPEEDAAKPESHAARLAAKNYVPKLRIRRGDLPTGGADDLLDCTFSVAASNSPVQLIVSPRGSTSSPGPLDISTSQLEIVLEAEVIAGAPVLDTEIRGMVERINPSTLQTETFAYNFRDDGVEPDRLAADGVATASVALPPSSRRFLSEYRVWVQAGSTPATRFIPLVDPVLSAGLDGLEKTMKPPPVPAFQLARSLDFYIRGRAIGEK